MNYNYAWAQNKSKLERAVKEVRGDNEASGELGKNEVSEEAVKKVYVRLLGVVLEEKDQPKEEKPKRNKKAE